MIHSRILKWLLATGLVLMLASVGQAEIIRSRKSCNTYHGRSMVEFRIGYRDTDNDNRSSLELWPGQRSSHNDLDDFTFSLGFQNWVDDNTALTIRASLLSLESKERISYYDGYYDGYYDAYYDEYREGHAVTEVLFGFRQYFPVSSPQVPLRPYVGAEIGPVFGTVWREYEEPYHTYTETETEVVLGGHIGGGVDFFMGPNLALNVHVGYNAIADFDRPVGGRTDYSGAEFGVGMGIAF